MSHSVVQFQNPISASRFERVAIEPLTSRWRIAEIAGRLVEVSGLEATAALTLAFALVLEAQRLGEPVAWITPVESSFYPPDAAEGGVDLDALVVIRIPEARVMARVADRLARSGGFGLIVLDLGAQVEVPTPLQARLAGLAQKHHAIVLCLKEKASTAPSLGSLVSLRVHAQRRRAPEGGFACELAVLKDKRRGPTWAHAEACRGPAGVR
ncbi:MAG: recombinase A [Candidatus Rokubacteria bacterium]|nr:recombinase A [Candidatus Rokubacteria bacterium]